jgi:hypothetical protein
VKGDLEDVVAEGEEHGLAVQAKGTPNVVLEQGVHDQPESAAHQPVVALANVPFTALFPCPSPPTCPFEFQSAWLEINAFGRMPSEDKNI